MKLKLSLVVTLLVAVTVVIGLMRAVAKSETIGANQKDLQQTLANRSKEVWEAYKTRNVAAMKALTADDYAAFTQAGPTNLQEDIATIDKLTIESYTIDDPKVSQVTKDVAILRYKCDLKGSFEGKPFKTVYATEVWVNRGGKWLIVSYSETPVA
ncbi:MAG: nuclear transport factor 2 family protein [Pyrinomonadaceae bacterium]